MDVEADQLRGSSGNSRNGYRERGLKTCVGELALRVPKLRGGSFFPEDVIERYQRVDRALAAAVAEMRAGGGGHGGGAQGPRVEPGACGQGRGQLRWRARFQALDRGRARERRGAYTNFSDTTAKRI